MMAGMKQLLEPIKVSWVRDPDGRIIGWDNAWSDCFNHRAILDESYSGLVDCSEYGLLCNDYYKEIKSDSEYANILDKYDTSGICLREEIVRDLLTVDRFIGNYGYRLLLRSGYRSMNMQVIAHRKFSALHGNAIADKLFASPLKHLPHATGAAFDVEMIEIATGKVVHMKSSIGISVDSLELRSSLSEVDNFARSNRRILINSLTSCAVPGLLEKFVVNPNEYWHFGRGEMLSYVTLRLTGTPGRLRYGEINLKEFK